MEGKENFGSGCVKLLSSLFFLQEAAGFKTMEAQIWSLLTGLCTLSCGVADKHASHLC